MLRLSPSAAMAERMHRLMERQLTNVTRLVDDLLDVSRLTRGVVTLKLRPVDVRDVMHQACEAAAAAARQKGLTLVRDVPETPLVVMADPVRLNQMVGNLLTNAIRFTQHGGRVEVQAERAGGDVRVCGRDTGKAFPPPVAPRLRPLRTIRSPHRSRPGRPGHRTDGGALACRTARRRRDDCQRG